LGEKIEKFRNVAVALFSQIGQSSSLIVKRENYLVTCAKDKTECA